MRKEDYLIQGLYDLIEYVGLPKDSKVVEIGSYRGESTKVWAENYSDVTAIDPWDFIVTSDTLKDFVNHLDKHKDRIDWNNLTTLLTGVEHSFDEAMKPYNITKLKMRSNEAIKQFEDQSIDMVYIDAMHDYDAVLKDITLWFPKIKDGGFVSGHDFDEERWPGVVKAVHDLLGEPEKVFQDTSWVWKKTL